jgi:hypothetical protein
VAHYDLERGFQEGSVEGSEWFSRAWTLQGLITPKIVAFCDAQWQVIGHTGYCCDSGSRTCEYTEARRLGRSLSEIVSKITKIPPVTNRGIELETSLDEPNACTDGYSTKPIEAALTGSRFERLYILNLHCTRIEAQDAGERLSHRT